MYYFYVRNQCVNRIIYLKPNGNAGHVAISGSGPRARVEDLYGAGTAFSHWKEAVYTGELMTGFLSGGLFLFAYFYHTYFLPIN